MEIGFFLNSCNDFFFYENNMPCTIFFLFLPMNITIF